MSVLSMVMITLGILAALFGLCALVIWLQKEHPSEKYDERQKIARGEGYRLTFWAGTVYYLLIMLGVGFEDPGADIVVALLIAGIAGQAMLLHIYCFLTHSVLPLGEKPKASVAGYSVMGGIYLMEFIFLDQSWNVLVYCICFLVLAAMHLISHLRQERE